jgi:hypothetical protein
MKISLKILLTAGLLCGTVAAGSLPATAQPSGFSFRIGDIGLAYDDGYYDRSHRWHGWRHQRERDWYRANYSHAYRGYRHDRDRDGVPNYRDRRPNNPYRR